MIPGEWMRDGLCAQVDPDIWFPPLGHTGKSAIRLCLKCGVLQKCRNYALTTDDELEGVWGALPQRLRREIRKGRAELPELPEVAA